MLQKINQEILLNIWNIDNDCERRKIIVHILWFIHLDLAVYIFLLIICIALLNNNKTMQDIHDQIIHLSKFIWESYAISFIIKHMKKKLCITPHHNIRQGRGKASLRQHGHYPPLALTKMNVSQNFTAKGLMNASTPSGPGYSDGRRQLPLVYSCRIMGCRLTPLTIRAS